MSVIASRYAEGLFSLANDKNKVALYKDQVSLLRNSFLDENIKKFFCSSRVSKEDKKQLIKNIFGDKLDEYIVNFLMLLIDKNRIEFYEEIFDEYIKLSNEELNIKVGVIESARPLDEKLIKELAKNISEDGETIELKPKINKTLISGFRISFENKIIDNTMKQKIEKMENILKGKDGNLWK